jgi:hypothetical protein
MDSLFASRLLKVIFVLAAISVTTVGVWLYFTQNSRLDPIDLHRVIALPGYLSRLPSDALCEVSLSGFTKLQNINDVRFGLGVLPQDNQIKGASIIEGCIRVDIAIYSDDESSETILQSLHQHATILGKEKELYSDMDMTMVANTYQAQSTSHFDITFYSNTRLLYGKKCNTVFTIFVFKRGEENDYWSEFGTVVNDTQIILYAEQISNRIDYLICPLLSN